MSEAIGGKRAVNFGPEIFGKNRDEPELGPDKKVRRRGTFRRCDKRGQIW